MTKYFEYGVIFLLLFAGLLMLIIRTNMLEELRKMLISARHSIDEQDRQTIILRRKNLSEFEKKNTLWLYIERQIGYSGLKRRFPGISAGKFIVLNIVALSIFFWIGSLSGKILTGILTAAGAFIAEFVAIQYMKSVNLRAVNEELPKLLDFLGNYSITGSELTSIFSQISVYLKEPLRGVLEECEAESRVTGDLQTALISMSDKIEHPQFKQLVSNIEVTSRYSADFSALVNDSRRSMREYLSQARDRKGLLREAGINMLLLIIMSAVVLLTVNMLIGGGIYEILFHSLVGHLALGTIGIVLALFALQAFSMNR